jgi:D-glycero-alpha-D-manno-heptose-7-phosphate kinase
MILTKTPLRMSFLGGGSDLSAFYRRETGAVLSATVNKYIYISVNKKFDNQIRVSYSTTEAVENVEQIKHPLVRESLKLANLEEGIEIGSMADIPSRGSGLGSSSSFTVGLINALFAIKGNVISKDRLAELACEVEIVRCGEIIGKQDQYAASYGGLNLISFHPDETVSVEPIKLAEHLIEDLLSSLLVFYTGKTRLASTVLSEQAKNIKNNSTRGLIRRMVTLAVDMKNKLNSQSIQDFGEFLHENWILKKQLSESISNDYIDHLYTLAMSSGATGGKLLGAGNGGFLLFFAPVEHHIKIRQSLNFLSEVKFSFDFLGSRIVFSD